MFWTRWKPFANNAWSSLNQLDTEINRVVDHWTKGAVRFGATSFPALNVWEEGETLVVEAELPGLALDDLEIFVTGQNQLTIKGERKNADVDKAAVHRQEREVGTFVRMLTLPFAVDDSKVEARLEHGVLTVRLPKHEAARPRKIHIKTS